MRWLIAAVLLAGCGESAEAGSCDQACALWSAYSDAASAARAAHDAYRRDFSAAWVAAAATCIQPDCSDRTAMAASDPAVVADLADLDAKSAQADLAYQDYQRAAVAAGLKPNPPIEV